jgi:hypothetical protein
MKFVRTSVIAAAVLFSSVVSAQQVDPGLHWSGSSGTSAGALCGGFTCTPAAIPVTVGEVVTISVRGTFGTAWAIGMSATATQCVAVPGVQHFLILDSPTIALTGVFTQGDPILSCPGGMASVSFVFPFLPPWTPLAIQAVGTLPNGTLSFTSAITVWVL